MKELNNLTVSTFPSGEYLSKVVHYANSTQSGGMGVTHSNKKTYPRLGDVIGFVPPNKINDVAEKIMLVQRDYGNRENRKNARLKYTIDNLTLPGFVGKLHEYLGYKLEEARPFKFDSNIDRYGWAQGQDGKWHFTMFVVSIFFVSRLVMLIGYSRKTDVSKTRSTVFNTRLVYVKLQRFTRVPSVLQPTNT